MTVKSVIEIDVLDEKFKAFQATFEKYKKQVADQNKSWKDTNKYIEEATKRTKALEKAIADSNFKLKDVANTTGTIAKNMASAALSAAKWIAYSAIGGGFGAGGLASSASNLLRTATGYGISPAQLRSVRTYGSPYLSGIEGVLGSIQSTQAKLTESWKIGLLGGDETKNAYENLLPILKKVRAAKDQFGGRIDVAMNSMPGLKDVLSEDQVLALWNMSNKSYSSMEQSLQSGAKNFITDEAKYEKVRQFWIQLEKAGNKIEDVFVDKLAKISPALSRLSDSITKALEQFLDSDQFSIWLEKLEKGIKEFADYISSPDAINDLNKFTTAVGNVVDGLTNLATLLGLFPKSEADQNAANQTNAITPLGSNTVGSVLGAGAGLVGNTSRSLVKNWYDYPLSTLTSLSNFLSTPLATSKTVTDFFKASTAYPGVDMGHVDPILANSLQKLGLTPISGYRSEEYARKKGIWHSGSHHTFVNASGFASAVDIDPNQVKALLAKYSDKQLKEQFDIYRPYPNDPREQNHFERWSTRDQKPTYVIIDGVVTKAASAAGHQ